MNPAAALAGPLAGLAVVVTRDEPPGGALAGRLAAAGARVLHWPTMAVQPPADPAPLTRALAGLASFDWLALTSVHAVDAVASRLGEGCAVLPEGLRLAVVGTSTAAAARERGFRVDRMPDDFSSEGLVRAFAEAGDANGSRILFPASDRAGKTLAAGLGGLGAKVQQIIAYRTTDVALEGPLCLAAAARGEVDVVTFASPSAVDGLARALGDPGLHELLTAAAAAVIGPTTAGALLRRGRTPEAIAAPATLDGLVRAALSAHLRFAERKLPCRS
ncbi:MAG: uroporphyrinogen-III synthase [Thermoanaerobaculia bacterium]